MSHKHVIQSRQMLLVIVVNNKASPVHGTPYGYLYAQTLPQFVLRVHKVRIALGIPVRIKGPLRVLLFVRFKGVVGLLEPVDICS